MSSATIAESARATVGNKPSTWTVVMYNSRTTMSPILPTNRTRPAHSYSSRPALPANGW